MASKSTLRLLLTGIEPYYAMLPQLDIKVEPITVYIKTEEEEPITVYINTAA